MNGILLPGTNLELSIVPALRRWARKMVHFLVLSYHGDRGWQRHSAYLSLVARQRKRMTSDA